MTFLMSLFFLCFSSLFANTCPSHTEIKNSHNFNNVSYVHRKATFSYSIIHNHKHLTLNMQLPNSPPFARTNHPRYNQKYSTEDKNWGFTEHYKYDFANHMIQYISLHTIPELPDYTKCIYYSMLENYLIYGDIFVDNVGK